MENDTDDLTPYQEGFHTACEGIGRHHDLAWGDDQIWQYENGYHHGEVRRIRDYALSRATHDPLT